MPKYDPMKVCIDPRTATVEELESMWSKAVFPEVRANARARAEYDKCSNHWYIITTEDMPPGFTGVASDGQHEYLIQDGEIVQHLSMRGLAW